MRRGVGFSGVVFAVGLMIAAVGTPGWAQVVDLAVGLADSADPVNEGESVMYYVEISNIGDTESNSNLIVDTYLPCDLPAPMADYLAGDQTAAELVQYLETTAQVSSNIWNASTSAIVVTEDSSCEYFILQAQNLGVVGGDTGYLFYDLTMPNLPTMDGAVHVTTGNRDVDLNFGRGACDPGQACSAYPCLGARISQISTPVEGLLELVDDGTAEPSLGCSGPVGFTSGRIALIDRGQCSFEDKAFNAFQAGAAGVIIADIGDFTDSTVEPGDVINMTCSNYCDQAAIPIPVAFVSWADAQALHEELAAGDVQVAMGRRSTAGVLTTTAWLWENGTSLDTNLTNNQAEETTEVGYIFKDGFEDESVDHWSDVVP